MVKGKSKILEIEKLNTGPLCCPQELHKDYYSEAPSNLPHRSSGDGVVGKTLAGQA